MRAIIFLVAFLLLGLLSPSQAWAARSIIISSDKASLFGEEYAAITASASGFTNGETIYIKGAFYQDGSTNYFGYTKSGDNWIKNGESTLSQRVITAGSWDNTLVIKSDFTDSGFVGEGTYKFKIGFYYITSGGNLSSVNWSSNSLDMSLNEPDPTPTQTPTPSPTPKPSNTPIPTATKIPTPTKIISKTPTPTQTISPTKTEVLGNETQNNSDVNQKIEYKDDMKIQEQNNNFLPLIFIAIGVVFLLACAIVFLYPKIREYVDNKNE